MYHLMRKENKTDSLLEKKPEFKPDVGLFVTCMVDIYRPSVAFACIKLLEAAGCRVSVPTRQTCCGQPGYNSGDRKSTVKLAKKFIREFEAFDYIVAPSGSCMAMIHDYPQLFASGSEWQSRAQAIKERCFEISSFLVDVLHFEAISSSCDNRIVYHDACSGLRRFNIKKQPRALLQQVENLKLEEMDDADQCCGFGGLFCVKFADISNQMVENKISHIEKSSAEMLVSGELGCLLHMAGKLSKQGKKIHVRHLVEVLVEGLGEGMGEGISKGMNVPALCQRKDTQSKGNTIDVSKQIEKP